MGHVPLQQLQKICQTFVAKGHDRNKCSTVTWWNPLQQQHHESCTTLILISTSLFGSLLFHSPRKRGNLKRSTCNAQIGKKVSSLFSLSYHLPCTGNCEPARASQHPPCSIPIFYVLCENQLPVYFLYYFLRHYLLQLLLFYPPCCISCLTSSKDLSKLKEENIM